MEDVGLEVDGDDPPRPMKPQFRMNYVIVAGQPNSNKVRRRPKQSLMLPNGRRRFVPALSYVDDVDRHLTETCRPNRISIQTERVSRGY